MKTRRDLPSLLRALRLARGWSLRTAASALHTSPSQIVRWESGSVPTLRSVRKISAAYGVSVDRLVA